MQQLFHCPNCNAGLDLGNGGAAIVRCDYCHSVVIVPESLRGKVETVEKAKPVIKKPPRPVKPQLSEEEAIAKITQLAQSGQQIEAMKLYREIYSVGLKETKEAIDQVETGLPLPIPEVKRQDEEDLPLAAAEEITHLAATGQLKEAANLYRITFGTSHVEARTAIEKLVEGKSIDVARSSARKEAQATAVRRDQGEPTQPGAYRFMGVGIVLFILFVIVVLFALVLVFAL